MKNNLEKFDIIFIGHFAIDTIIYNNVLSHSLGGGVTYGSLASYYFNPFLKLWICSVVGRDFNKKLLNIFSKTNIDLSGVMSDSKHSTNYKLHYYNGTRSLILKHKASPIYCC